MSHLPLLSESGSQEKTSRQRLINSFDRSWLRRIHRNNLLYTICWEDSQTDRQWLNLNRSSKVLMHTSTGCRALDYLLDDPEKIVCLDENYRQNALLELKRSVFGRLTYSDAWRLFGCGNHHQFEKIYKDLKADLPAYVARFWDRRLHYFDGRRLLQSFYYHGTSGAGAYCFQLFLKRLPCLKDSVMSLLEADSLEDQKRIYDSIEPILFNRLVRWTFKTPAYVSLLGLPFSPNNLLESTEPDRGSLDLVKSKLRRSLTEFPIQENYFWQIFFRGFYTRNCCPSYLKQSNFSDLKQRTQKISSHTESVTNYLRSTSESFSHFVFFDRHDQLEADTRETVENEWNEIFNHALPGAKILMRSHHRRIEKLPQWVLNRPVDDQSGYDRLMEQDRVGTSGCFFLAKVK